MEAREQRALMNIGAIVNAYYNGTLVITTEKNGYCDGLYGLDVIMAIINNCVIEGTQSPTQRQGGFLYV